METINGIVGVLMAIVNYALVYWFSALIHEFAHCAVGMYYGVKAVKIKPAPLAWETYFIADKNWDNMMSRPLSKLAMASAGWVAHVLMLVISVTVIAFYGPDILAGFVKKLAWVNGILVIWLAIPTGKPEIDSDMCYEAIRDFRKAKQAT